MPSPTTCKHLAYGKKGVCHICSKPQKKSRGTKCGTIEVRGRRGRITVYKGKEGGVYYLTPSGDKTYVDSKDCPKPCGPGAGRRRRRRSKSPKRRRRSKSPKRHTKHVHVTRTSLKRKYLKDKLLHKHPK